MPHYHINIQSDSHIAATLTVEREDDAALRLELAKFVGEMLKDHPDQIWIDEDWHIDLSDESGLILYVVNVSAMKTSATMTGRW